MSTLNFRNEAFFRIFPHGHHMSRLFSPSQPLAVARSGDAFLAIGEKIENYWKLINKTIRGFQSPSSRGNKSRQSKHFRDE